MTVFDLCNVSADRGEPDPETGCETGVGVAATASCSTSLAFPQVTTAGSDPRASSHVWLAKPSDGDV